VETYQDAYSPSGSAKGERDCEARWPLVEAHLPERGMVLDIGSNLGYFGLRAASERPGVAVVSIEADPFIAQRQGQLAAELGTDRVAVLRGGVSAATTSAWAEACPWFDLTLLLSILHWLDDPAAVVRSLSSMSGRMLCEVPDPDDEGACGQQKLAAWADPVAWFEEVTGRPCRLVGQMQRHTSATPSHVVLVEGPVRRTPARPYWSESAPPSDGRHVLSWDGQAVELEIAGEARPWVPGANVLDLMKVGALVHPSSEWWVAAAREELAAHPEHPDPLPHNMVWGPDGISLIDFDPVDALHTPADGLRTLESNVARWVDGSTVDAAVSLRELTAVHRLRYSRAGRLAFRVLPGPVTRALRSAVRALSNRRI
jgi:hypothetical protein